MNRAILLQRTPPDRLDLIKIGRGIGDKTCQKLTAPLIPDLADGYLEVYNVQEKEYFGLRDYYSLVRRRGNDFKDVYLYVSLLR